MKPSKKNSIITVTVISLLLIALFLIVTYEKDKEETDTSFRASISNVIKFIGNKVSSKDGTGSSNAKETYTDTKYGFSFKHSKGVTIGTFSEGDGDIVLVQTSDKETEFQMFVIPYDEAGPITASRIKQDLPTLVIKDPQNVVISGGGLEALIFESESESLGATREVWFVKNGYLYQITSSIDKDWFVGPILETLRFTK